MGKHVIFDIDVEGGMSIKKKYGPKALGIFVKPLSIDILKQRLIERSTETKEQLAIRMKKAVSEMEYQDKFDYILINEDLAIAFEEAEKLIEHFTGLRKN